MRYLVYILLLNCISPLDADISLTYSLDYEKLKFQYKDDSNSQLHIISPDEKIALYTINDSSFLVKVIDNVAKTIAIDDNLRTSISVDFNQSNYKIRKYKTQKLIAGVHGTKWMIYGHDGGQVYSQIIYVSNNKNVVKSINAMFDALSLTSDDPNRKFNFFEIEPGFVIIEAQGMRLKYFQELALPTSPYLLPKSSNPKAFFK